MKLPVALFDNKKDNQPKRRLLSWEQLRLNLTTHEARRKKDGTLWGPTRYREGATRGLAGVVCVSLLVLDFDNGADPAAFAEAWAAWEYIVHSTYSSTSERKAWRAVFPLIEPVPAERWPEVYRKLALALGDGQTDPSCKDASRIYYTPAHPLGETPFAFHHAGEWLDPEAFPDPEPEPRPEPIRLTRPASNGTGDDRPAVDLILARALADLSEGRHKRALFLVSQLRDNGYSEHEAEPVLAEFISLCPGTNTKGDREPFTDREAHSILDYVYSTPAREPWAPSRRVLAGGVSGPLPMFPCLRTLIGLKSELMIETRDRDNVLFALVSQCKAQVFEPGWAEAAIWNVNVQRCREPLEKDAFLTLFQRSWASNHSHPHCDLIQQANLCPFLLYGEECAAQTKADERQQQVRESLVTDPNALTITPLSVMRTEPPIYTATIRGRHVQFSLEQLCNFTLFKKHVLGTLDFIPQCPVIELNGKRVSDTKAWELVVNEAMKTLTEEAAPPEDASPRGAVWSEIRSFLTDGRLSENRDDLRKGHVVLSEVNGSDCYLFKGESLRRYLKLNRVDELSIGQVWKLIADKGGRNAMVDAPSGKIRAYVVPLNSLLEDLETPSGSGKTDL